MIRAQTNVTIAGQPEKNNKKEDKGHTKYIEPTAIFDNIRLDKRE